MDLTDRCGECLLFGAIQGMSDALVLADPEGRVFHVNRAAKSLLDLEQQSARGERITSILGDVRLLAFWASSSSEEAPVSTDLTLADGTCLRATISRCLSSRGETIGRALLLRNVTREKRIQIELSDDVARRLAALAGDGEPDAAIDSLTVREQEILGLLVEGLSNAAIADRIHISPHTVASHLKNLYAKLDVDGRAQAVALAVLQGIHPSWGNRSPGS